MSGQDARFCRDRNQALFRLDPSHSPLFIKPDKTGPVREDREHVTKTSSFSQFRERPGGAL